MADARNSATYEHGDENGKIQKPDFYILHNTISASTGKLCLFASYNFTEEVADYVVYYLAELQKEGYTIAFITTSVLSEASMGVLKSCCALIVTRENKGLDFASWQLGLQICDWAAGYQEVLIANDSVFGPLQPLGPILNAMNRRYDMWGMTDNYDIDYHLQSYFIHFNETIIESAAWLQFWQQMNTTNLPKDEIIKRYEVGMLKTFVDAGFRLGVYVSIDTLVKSAGGTDKEISPPLVYWQPLIEKFNFPFLKRELLINMGIGTAYWYKNIYINTAQWRRIITTESVYPVHLIDEFLAQYYQSLARKNPKIKVTKKKILFVCESAEAGDGQKMLLSLLKWLQKNSDVPFEVLFASSSDKELLYDEFASLSTVTRFDKLNKAESIELKDRLTGEFVGLIVSYSFSTIALQQFLSFLQAPQLFYVYSASNLQSELAAINTHKKWLRENIAHYIVSTEGIKKKLTAYFNLDDSNVSMVPNFIDEPEATIESAGFKKKLYQLNLPNRAFIVGISTLPDSPASAHLVPAITTLLCKQNKNIHIVWLQADLKNPLHQTIESDLYQAGVQDQVHLVQGQQELREYYTLFDVFLMPTKEEASPLLYLELAIRGIPVIHFEKNKSNAEATANLFGNAVPYLDLVAMRDAVLYYFTNREQLEQKGAEIAEAVRCNFLTAVQAPKLYEVIAVHFDENEKVVVEHPSITIMTHIFYDNTWKDLKYKLNFFKTTNTRFLFSISEACLIKEELVQDIYASFSNAHVLTTSNIGKDIGGKFALIGLYLSLELKSEYIIFLHDKQSPHSLIGDSWKSNLQKIIDHKNYKHIVRVFEQNEDVGVVGAKEHLISEYDYTNGTFLNNNDLIHVFLKKYAISLSNYEFFGGTMYWMRAAVIENFFSKYNPMQIRSELEAGNVLDNHGSTNAHTWERVLSWVATSQGYHLYGI